MANQRESKLKIIRDLPHIPTSIRVARVASSLLSPRDAAVEAELFSRQYHPDGLNCKDVVELVDLRGNTIGGAIIWEARWDKHRIEQALQAARCVLREAFDKQQSSLPQALRRN
jgi:hypothetical protein